MNSYLFNDINDLLGRSMGIMLNWKVYNVYSGFLSLTWKKGGAGSNDPTPKHGEEGARILILFHTHAEIKF